jgi:GR25 family glycosyltransferase involved in LPS biosynthesis
MDYQLSKIDIPFEFIENYDQEQISEEIYQNNFDETLETKITKKIFVKDNSPEMINKLNRGELSIALKQKEAMRMITSSGVPDDQYFFILEDDIFFKKSIEIIYETIKILNEKNIKHDIIFFGEASLLKDCEEEFCFKKENPATNGLCTYVITKKAAEILYNDLCIEKISFPIDHEFNYRFFKNNLEVFWATPITKHGSINGSFKSTLR